MGEFQAGKWLIGLSIYFFILTTLIFVSVEAGREYGLDTDGIRSYGQTYTYDETENGCSGIVSTLCGQMRGADANETCEVVQGCSYEYLTFSGTFACTGTHNISDCSTVSNVDTCLSLGCTYTGIEQPTTIDPNDKYDQSAVRATFDTMFGFSAFFGLPPEIAWIIRFLAIIIPSMIFIWALYMSAPFIH